MALERDGSQRRSATRMIIVLALVVAALGFIWMFVQYSGVLPGDRGTPPGVSEQPELEGPPA